MKKLNRCLRDIKNIYSDSYLDRGYEKRVANLFFSDVLLHSRWYHSITYTVTYK